MSKIFFLQKNNARPKIHNSTKHAIYKHITHMQDKQSNKTSKHIDRTRFPMLFNIKIFHLICIYSYIITHIILIEDAGGWTCI